MQPLAKHPDVPQCPICGGLIASHLDEATDSIGRPIHFWCETRNDDSKAERR